MVSYIKKDALKLTIPINIIQKMREFSNTEKKNCFCEWGYFHNCHQLYIRCFHGEKGDCPIHCICLKEGEKLYQYVGLT